MSAEASEDRIQPHLGRWFEDLPVGTSIVHALTRTITESDNVFFCALTMNPAAIHLDAEYASSTEFGGPIVNSLFTLGLVIGISVLETTHGTTVANLGFDEVVFPAPVRPGDTIHAESVVVASRPSGSRPTAGVVTFDHRGYNQHERLVCSARRHALMLRRPVV